MKILILSHEYPPIGGGGANACMNLAREYAARGHEVHIVTVWYEGLEDKEEIPNKDGKVIIYRLHSRRKHLEHCSFSEMLDYLLKCIPFADRLQRKERFDVCQVFFGIPSGPVGYYLKKRYKLPYVIRFGGGDIPGAQKRFALIYKLLEPFIKLIWKNADALVANSEGLKMRAEFFYDKKRITIIPNGVRRFDNGDVEKEARSTNEIRLLFVSRLIESKGLQDFIPIMKKLCDRFWAEGSKIKLTIVGDGPYRQELLLRVNKYGASKFIEFTGQKTKQELPYYYYNSDIFVFPSRSEGMSNSVLEAMSCGLPIVMTTCEGSKELIDGNGYAVPVYKFYDRITELIGNPEKRREFSERSLYLVRERFDWGKAADSYLELFGVY